MATDRFPSTLLTGFLGSGKTTLLNAWLASPSLADAAVIVNEFGENRHRSHADCAKLRQYGAALYRVSVLHRAWRPVDTLRDLNERRERGEIRAFDRVFIETTGLADRSP